MGLIGCPRGLKGGWFIGGLIGGMGGLTDGLLGRDGFLFAI